MSERGFTLIELLASMIILAVILVISVPRILALINDTTKTSMETTGKLIASNAEKKYVESETLGTLDWIDSLITCSDVATYSSSNYSECTIEFNNEKATVTLIGAGKFEGYICSGNKNSVECKLSDSTLAVTVLKNSGDMYQDDTDDENYRYKGANPNNYVKFNGEEWRIIGIFNISGEERIKLIGPSLGNYSWDTSPSAYNTGYGYNIWETITGKTKGDGTTKADVNRLLNELYLGEENQEEPVICYNARHGDATINPQVGVANCPEARLNSSAKEIIDETVWNLGGATYGLSIKTSYVAERGTNMYLPAISKTEWTGKVGLIYPSDYGYAANNCSLLSDSSNCKKDNWLFTSSSYWTMSLDTGRAYRVLSVTTGGYVEYYSTYSASNIRPVVYLKSNIKIISGDGTSGVNAYELEL